MESKEITCDTFFATFSTSVSQQGACNLAWHEKKCANCALRSAAKREFDAVENVTCENFREIVALGESKSEAEARSFYKHRQHCISAVCRNWYAGNVLQPLCNVMNGWTPQEGDTVKITDGPFENFRGQIIKVGDGEIEVSTDVFGRLTTVQVFQYALEYPSSVQS